MPANHAKAAEATRALIVNVEQQLATLRELAETLERGPQLAPETKAANRAAQQAERARYVDGQIDHGAYYCWLAGFIGADTSLVPFTPEQIARSRDPHLNDLLPLAIWDKQDGPLRKLAYAAGLPWSLSDTVSTLKALARTLVAPAEEPRP